MKEKLTFKEFLQETIHETIKNYNEFSILEWLNVFLEYEDIFLNYPQIKKIDFIGDEYFYDEFDFENFEILEIDLDCNNLFFRASINQQPTEILCSYIDNSIEFEILERNEYDYPLTDEEFLSKVIGENWYNILIEKFNYKHGL